MSLATDAIHRNKFKSKRYTLQRHRRSCSYKVVMYIQKLHHFCNRPSADDGQKSVRKYGGNKWLWKIYQPIPTEYYKINTAIWKDQQKICRQKMSIMFNEIYIYIYNQITVYTLNGKVPLHIDLKNVFMINIYL